MKNLFKYVTLKNVLYVSIAILLILIVIGFVLLIEWPWWSGICLLVAIIGVFFGLLFLRNKWIKLREKKFVQQVIDQDDQQCAALDGKERDKHKELQKKWKEGVEALKRSHLRRHGNPLYVLPWYMVIGESGSGKTTAISSAKLSAPFAENLRTSGISGTRNCDWWFFEQAIILDTAGRWAIPIDESRDKDEWRKFLKLLRKYRKREPLNGVVVTIAADTLLNTKPEELEAEGQEIRQRINELMDGLGFGFPVYILVTKCDLILGMTKLCDQLSEKSLDQPMGHVNQKRSTDVVAFLEQTIDTITERLRRFRLLFLNQSEPKDVDAGILLFPDEFRNLKKGLEPFIRGTLLKNVYQAKSSLRGLYFSSGRQEGSPYSHFLNKLDIIGEKEVLPGTSRGLFLHDFFSKILPKDRKLYFRTSVGMSGREHIRNLAITSWFILCVALCGVLSFSFVKNLKIIRDVPREFVSGIWYEGNSMERIGMMDHFCKTIQNMEVRNRNWWIPRLGLNKSIHVEMQLKKKYCEYYTKRFLEDFDNNERGIVTAFTSNTSNNILGLHVAHLVKRINLIGARLDGEEFENLSARPQPFLDSTVMAMAGLEQYPGKLQVFADLYLHKITWWKKDELDNERKDLWELINHILTMEGANLNWLVTWVNADSPHSGFTLTDFWGGDRAESSGPVVQPAFTQEGAKKIDSFLEYFRSALPKKVIFDEKKQQFLDWYRKEYITAWFDFMDGFPKGIDLLIGKEEWQEVAAKVVSHEGPYFTLLELVTKELDPVMNKYNLPEWIKNIDSLRKARVRAASPVAEGGMVSSALERGRKLFGKNEGGLDQLHSDGTPASQFSVTKAFRDYLETLTAMKPASSSRNEAFAMISKAYTEDPVTGKSLVWTARDAIKKLRAAMVNTNSDEKNMLKKLTNGPLDFLKIYMVKETACYLQNKWIKEVRKELEGISSQGQRNVRIELILEFIEGDDVKPFLDWGLKKGYYARNLMGVQVPFDEQFLSFITNGKRNAKPRQVYYVSIETIPTDTNPEAIVKPDSTLLELKCASGNQSLVNEHFPVERIFNWEPGTCSDVTLNIDVGETRLIKRYKGDLAFRNFLSEFKGGQRVFYPDDFPEQQIFLEDKKIKYINVNYEFVSGHQEILEHYDPLLDQTPGNITQCWDQ